MDSPSHNRNRNRNRNRNITKPNKIFVQRRRAKRNRLSLVKDRWKPYDAWYIVKIDINGVVSNGSLYLEDIAGWLDDFEAE